MITAPMRAAFEAQVAAPTNIAAITQAAANARAAAPDAAITLAASLAQAAFTAPENIAAIYDAAASGWLARPTPGTVIPGGTQPAEPLTTGFWNIFWALAEDSTNAISAGEITSRTAGLAALLAPGFQPRAAAASAAYPGATTAAANGFPARIRLQDLQLAPAGSLGHEFYRLLVDNNYDIEVLDRDTLNLQSLIAPLDYLNARMLQTHDLWHITAGYHTTKLHEIALSAFQLSQFGHNYSAMFLALVVATAAHTAPAAIPLLLETIFTAWQHGRETPPMMLIPWEQAWAEPTEALRVRYGITPYASPYPANIIELFESAA